MITYQCLSYSLRDENRECRSGRAPHSPFPFPDSLLFLERLAILGITELELGLHSAYFQKCE